MMIPGYPMKLQKLSANQRCSIKSFLIQTKESKKLKNQRAELQKGNSLTNWEWEVCSTDHQHAPRYFYNAAAVKSNTPATGSLSYKNKQRGLSRVSSLKHMSAFYRIVEKFTSTIQKGNFTASPTHIWDLVIITFSQDWKNFLAGVPMKTMNNRRCLLLSGWKNWRKTNAKKDYKNFYDRCLNLIGDNL